MISVLVGGPDRGSGRVSEECAVPVGVKMKAVDLDVWEESVLEGGSFIKMRVKSSSLSSLAHLCLEQGQRSTG